MLDLSRNKLHSDAFSNLDISVDNYDEVASLILSHNSLSRIDGKVLELRPHRELLVDHNQLTEISSDLSLLIQSFQENKVMLGHNNWRCECNAEITNMALLSKLSDLESVICSQESSPEQVVGKMLSEVDPELLCPGAPQVQLKEMLLQVLCVVLALVNFIVFTKLLYDYWQYKQRGKLPRIIHLIPFL